MTARSENRQRTVLVAVRFTPEEHALLTEAADRAGKGESTLLRETFLSSDFSGRAPLLGKRVRVTFENGMPLIEGVLLGFGRDGEFQIQTDDGDIRYGWPALAIEEVPS